MKCVIKFYFLVCFITLYKLCIINKKASNRFMNKKILFYHTKFNIMSFDKILMKNNPLNPKCILNEKNLNELPTHLFQSVQKPGGFEL